MGELWEKHNATLRAQSSPRKVTSPAKSSRNITTISVDNEKQSIPGANPRRTKKARYASFTFTLNGVC